MDIAEIDTRHKAYPVRVRDKYLRVGRQYGSKSVLAQANRVLSGLLLYRGALADHGFGADDEADLVWNHAGLSVAWAGRSDAEVESKVTNEALTKAEAEAQKTRKGVRSLVRGVPEKLRLRGTEAAEEAADLVDGVLAKTSAAGDDAEAQAIQLDQLAGLLGNALVIEVVGAERAQQRAEEIRSVGATLRAAETKHSRPRGTPAETQRMDLLDGPLVLLARRARASAVAAAEALSNPAIAKAFELVDLGSR